MLQVAVVEEVLHQQAVHPVVLNGIGLVLTAEVEILECFLIDRFPNFLARNEGDVVGVLIVDKAKGAIKDVGKHHHRRGKTEERYKE